jgi:hypothetical protein
VGFTNNHDWSQQCELKSYWTWERITLMALPFGTLWVPEDSTIDEIRCVEPFSSN